MGRILLRSRQTSFAGLALFEQDFTVCQATSGTDKDLNSDPWRRQTDEEVPILFDLCHCG
jgi:hypothetical protein